MLRHLPARIVLPIALVLAVTLASSSWVTWYQLRDDVAASLQGYADGLVRLVVRGLKESMRRNDREYLRREIEDIGHLEWVRSIRVINKEGRVAFASDPADTGHRIARVAETCQVCHESDSPPVSRIQANLAADASGSILRVSRMILAEPECAECHDPAGGRGLGVLVIDLDTAPLVHDVRARAYRNLWILVLGSVALLAILVYVVRGQVTGRLHGLAESLAAIRRGTALGPRGSGGGDEIDELKGAVAALGTDLEDRVYTGEVLGCLDRELGGKGQGILLVSEAGEVLLANDAALLALGAGFGEVAGRSYAGIDAVRGRLWREAARSPVTVFPEASGPEGAALALFRLDDGDGGLLGWMEVGRASERDEAEASARSSVGFPRAFLRSVYRTPDGGGDALFRAVVLVSRLSRDSLPRETKVISLDRTLRDGIATFDRLLSVSAAVNERVGPCDVMEIVPDVVADVRRARRDWVRWHVLRRGAASLVAHPVLLRQLVIHLVEMAVEAKGSNIVVFVHPHRGSPSFSLGVWTDGRGDWRPAPLPWGLCTDIVRRFNGSIEFDAAYDVGALDAAHPGTVTGLGVGRLLLVEFPWTPA